MLHIGASTGLLAGSIGLRFAGFAIAGGPVLGILFFGATIGAMMNGLAGLQVGNSKIKKYEEAIVFLFALIFPLKKVLENTRQTNNLHLERLGELFGK